jgi:hypothetical protein
MKTKKKKKKKVRKVIAGIIKQRLMKRANKTDLERPISLSIKVLPTTKLRQVLKRFPS